MFELYVAGVGIYWALVVIGLPSRLAPCFGTLAANMAKVGRYWRINEGWTDERVPVWRQVAGELRLSAFVGLFSWVAVIVDLVWLRRVRLNLLGAPQGVSELDWRLRNVALSSDEVRDLLLKRAEAAQGRRLSEYETALLNAELRGETLPSLPTCWLCGSAVRAHVDEQVCSTCRARANEPPDPSWRGQLKLGFGSVRWGMSVEEVRAALPDAERAGEDDRVLGIYRKLTKDVETTTILFEFLEGRLFEIAVIFKMSGDVLTGAEKELVTNLLLNCLGFAGASNDDGRNGWHNEETHAFLGVAQGTCGLTLRSRTHEPFYLREKKLFGLGEPSP